MHPFLLSSLLFLPAAEPPKPPNPPSKEVVIQDRAILIPQVPASVKQANAEYGRIGPMIATGILDLDKELILLLDSDSKLKAIQATIRIRPSEREAAAFFGTILKDDHYVHLLVPAIKAWNEWQSLLLGTGLTTREPQALATPHGLSHEDAAVQTRLKRQKQMSENYLQEERDLMRIEATDPISGGFDPYAFRFLMETTTDHESRVSTSIRLMTVANKKAPQLAQAWNPLVDHLNACAIKLADLDLLASPNPSEGFARLKRLAKIRFLERFRSAMWFSSAVWARMASAAPPAPLRALDFPRQP